METCGTQRNRVDVDSQVSVVSGPPEVEMFVAAAETFPMGPISGSMARIKQTTANLFKL